MTPDQIEFARHALGLTNGRKVSYRNHYCCSSGPDHLAWMAMREAGDARRRLGSPMSGGDDIFWLTLSGARKALQKGERLDLEDFPTLALTPHEGKMP